MTPVCSLTVGGLHCEAVPGKIAQALDADGIALEAADDIASRLWEKWAFIAAGVITCLFRGTIGDILAARGETKILEAIDECERIAAAAGHPVSEAGHAQSLALLTEQGSTAFTSSLYRDLQHDDPVEAEHIISVTSSPVRRNYECLHYCWRPLCSSCALSTRR